MLIAALLIGCVRRRSLNPGWIPIVLSLACGGLFIWHHMNEVRPREPNLFRVGYSIYPQFKTPYIMQSQPPVDSQGITCTPAPWGGITAVNLNTLTKVWENPLGSVVPGKHTGVVSFGGPIVTASGLVITAGTQQPWLHIFDSATGQELRQLPLPAPASATPMTYTLDGRQYIVIAAGGHRDGYGPLGDSLIAFAIN